MELVPFPAIQQYRNVVHDILHVADRDAVKPVITFKGTVKLHGTNAAVGFNGGDGLWVQSRTQIITPEQDNAGFAGFAEARGPVFVNLIDRLYKENGLFWLQSSVVLFGEWVGKGVQGGAAIVNLDKSFFIFAALALPRMDVTLAETTSLVPAWLPIAGLSSPEHRIYNIEDYPTFEIEVDFSNPTLVQNRLIELTEAVEKECPVAKAFGHCGVGEGIVWTGEYKGETYRFKVKGAEHSVTKVTKLAAVDTEKLESAQAFVAYAVTQARVDQAISTVCAGELLDTRFTGDIIRWVQNDVLKEEADTLAANRLEHRFVAPKIADATRKLFFARMATG
jgi:hypothetical protein